MPIRYTISMKDAKTHNVCTWDTEAGHNAQIKACGNSMKISVYTGSLCKSNNKLVLMINRLSYLYTRARGQHTLWHPSSLSNGARNDTAYGDSKTHARAPTHRRKHTQVNTHKHTVLTISVTRSLSYKHSKTRTHIHKNLPVFNTTG